MANFFRILGLAGITLFLLYRVFLLLIDFILLIDQNLRFIPDFLYNFIQEVFYRGYFSSIILDMTSIVLAGGIILVVLSLPTNSK